METENENERDLACKMTSCMRNLQERLVCMCVCERERERWVSFKYCEVKGVHIDVTAAVSPD